MNDLTLDRKLGDPYAFAFLQWPATLGLLTLSNAGWQLWAKIALGIWLAAMILASYGGRRIGRAAFGSAMTLTNVTIAAFWWTHPGGWMYFWLVLTLLFFFTAQKSLFRGARIDSGSATNEQVTDSATSATDSNGGY